MSHSLRVAVRLAALLLVVSCGGEAAQVLDGGPLADGGTAVDGGIASDGGNVADGSIPGDGGFGSDGGLAPDGGLTCRPLPAFVRDGGLRDDWRWQKRGVVAGLPEGAAAGDGLLSPALVFASGTLHLYFAKKTGLTHLLYHATSIDRGATWTGLSPVAGLRQSEIVAYPSALFEEGRFRLWYGSGSFDAAESNDGTSFTLVNERVLTAGESGFDSLGVLYPSLVAGPIGHVLFYTGYDGRNFSIGRALPADGGAFARSPSTAVLRPGSGSEFDNKSAAQPSVRYAGGRYLMWYGGYDLSVTNPGPYRVGLAESLDGLTWEKRGVAVELAEAGADAWSTRDPAVAADERGYIMLYVGMAPDRVYRLLRAEADVCP